jgi:hypothetical protein
MKNRFLILSVVMATLFACSGDSMISDDFNETAEKRKAVPFKVKKLAGTYILNGDCGAATLTAIGEGTVAHLGKSAILEEWCWSGAPTDVGTRSVTFTAANGDELQGTITSIVYTSPLTFIEGVTIEGGTGRFENAQGTITEYVEISQPQSPTAATGTFIYSAEGTITY